MCRVWQNLSRSPLLLADVALVIEPDLDLLAVLRRRAAPDAHAVLAQVADILEAALRYTTLGFALAE